MAIVKVQSATGNGATITLNGVAAASLLVLCDSYFRASSTGLAEAVPTDTQGTWSTGAAGVPGTAIGADSGSGIFYQANVAAGTHTVTPQANSDKNSTLVEFSGIATSLPLDGSNTAKTDSSSFTSQVTGTTGTTTQADELVVIALGLAAATGVANVGFTDPVSGFTSLSVLPNDSTSIATFHAFKTISATGTQAATFNWTDNEAGQFAGAAIATFKATGPAGPTIDTQPTSQSANPGATATFTVAATTSGGTLHYQWYKNGATVGTDSATYAPTAAYADQGAAVYVVVSDNNGGTTSNTVSLTVNATTGWAQPNAFQSTGFMVLYGVAAGDASAEITGVAATGSAGTVAAIVDVDVELTGVAAVAAVSAPEVSVSVAQAITGVAATGSASAPTASSDSTATITGVAATGTAAAPTASVASADASIELTGVAATGSVSAPSPRVDANVTLGVSAGESASESFAGLTAGTDLDALPNWVQRSAGGIVGAGSGNAIKGASGGDAVYEYTGGTFAAEQWAELRVVHAGSAGGHFFGPAVRVTSGGDCWGFIASGDSSAYLNRYTGGAYGGESYPTSQPPSGTVVRLSIADLGGGNSRLRVYYDGVLNQTQDVSTGPASGNPGISAFGTDTVAYGDDWAASDLAAGASSGLEAVASAGTLSAKVDAAQLLTGVQALGEVSAPTATGGVSIDGDTTLVGVQATGQVGTVTASAATDAQVTLAATAATGSVGTLSIASEPIVALAGVSAAGAASSPVASVDTAVALSGVQASGQAGTVSASASTDAQALVVGVQATGTAGTITASGDVTVVLGSVSASGQASAPDGSTTVSAAITGVHASGQIGPVIAAAATDADVLLAGVQAAGAAGDLVAYSDAAVVTLEGVGATGEVGTLGVPQARVDLALDDAVLGQIAAHILEQQRIAQRIDATVGLVGVCADGSAGKITAARASPLRYVPRLVAPKQPIITPPPTVTLRPRIDAVVQLPSVGAEILPFRPREATAPVAIDDPELLERGHAAAMMLLAAGWR